MLKTYSLETGHMLQTLVVGNVERVCFSNSLLFMLVRHATHVALWSADADRLKLLRSFDCGQQVWFTSNMIAVYGGLRVRTKSRKGLLGSSVVRDLHPPVRNLYAWSLPKLNLVVKHVVEEDEPLIAEYLGDYVLFASLQWMPVTRRDSGDLGSYWDRSSLHPSFFSKQRSTVSTCTSRASRRQVCPSPYRRTSGSMRGRKQQMHTQAQSMQCSQESFLSHPTAAGVDPGDLSWDGFGLISSSVTDLYLQVPASPFRKSTSKFGSSASRSRQRGFIKSCQSMDDKQVAKKVMGFMYERVVRKLKNEAFLRRLKKQEEDIKTRRRDEESKKTDGRGTVLEWKAFKLQRQMVINSSKEYLQGLYRRVDFKLRRAHSLGNPVSPRRKIDSLKEERSLSPFEGSLSRGHIRKKEPGEKSTLYHDPTLIHYCYPEPDVFIPLFVHLPKPRRQANNRVKRSE